MAGAKQKAEFHSTVSMGRSTVVCRCGWAFSRKELCDTEEQDHEALRTLHAQHVLKAIKGG